ncbi:hypothetical protein [Erythrobacter sp.]|uniref:hypothetical protein n=1 Tax=Erythrobacter sp. TaxID=1042 RepID=UPI001425CB37|nr:hypothetical protein [Erythrobacter sp.]QIQ85711.1 MAG: hypothetical protein G9473_02680 [Erythrobacter sp.]
MTNIWQTGDLALCIKQGRWRDTATREAVDFGPRAGQILTVAHVGRGSTPHGATVLLGFDEWGRDRFAAGNFVRVTPDADRSEAEQESAASSRVRAAETPPDRGEAEPCDDVGERLEQVEELLGRKELGRFHPELGDVYDQLEPEMQRKLDSIIRTTLIQKRLHLRSGRAQ